MGQAFRERLAESTRGRASRSRRKSDVATIKEIADYLPTTKKGAVITKFKSVDNQTSALFLLAYIYCCACRQTATAFLTARPLRGDIVCRSPLDKNKIITKFVGQRFVI